MSPRVVKRLRNFGPKHWQALTLTDLLEIYEQRPGYGRLDTIVN